MTTGFGEYFRTLRAGSLDVRRGGARRPRPNPMETRILAALMVTATLLIVAAQPAGAGTAAGNLFYAGVNGASAWTATGVTSGTDVNASNNTIYWVDPMGQEWSLGSDGDGARGSGTGPGKAPTEVTGMSDVEAMSNWRFGADALTPQGVYVWGSDVNSQYCYKGASSDEPVLDTTLPSGVTQIAGGYERSYFLIGDSEVLQCGNGKGPSAVALPAGATVERITSGMVDACALLDPATVSGTNVYCWGANADGQLGDGSDGHAKTPQPVAGGQTWAQVACGGGKVKGGDGTCIAVNVSGQVYTWGQGTDGQLGDGGTADADTPVQVDFPAGFSGVDLSLPYPLTGGAADIALIDNEGNLWAWGNADTLGTGQTQNQLTPKVVATGVAAAWFGNSTSMYVSTGL